MIKQRGFTLIELMMVFLIISILAIIALPVYRDYTIRAKVSEALTAVGPVKKLLIEYHANNNSFPADSAALGINPLIYKSQYVQQVAVTGSAVTVTLDAPGVEGETIIFNLTFVSAYNWVCTGGTLGDEHRPTDCR